MDDAALHVVTGAVVIARGDLAVAIGFERLAEMQEEILWLCKAAHVPMIRATQVLEGHWDARQAPGRARSPNSLSGRFPKGKPIRNVCAQV